MWNDYLKTTKNNLILIIILLLVFLVVALIFGEPQRIKTPNLINNTSFITDEENVVSQTFETREIKKDDVYVNFDIKYPYFFYAGPEFNSSIKDFIETQVDAHSNASRETWQARYETANGDSSISKTPQSDEEKFYFFSDFEVIQSNSTYISVVVHYGGFSGGAHGYENKISFAYDIKNKKEITLADLFAGDIDYLNKVSNYSREYFSQTLEQKTKEIFTDEEDQGLIEEYINNSMQMIESGTRPTLENFSVFSFTKNKIIIYFGQYQVGPYSEGMQEIEIER